MSQAGAAGAGAGSAKSNGAGGAGDAGAAGARRLGEESVEVQRIGALLRGEGDPGAGGDDKGKAAGDDDKGKSGPGEGEGEEEASAGAPGARSSSGEDEALEDGEDLDGGDAGEGEEEAGAAGDDSVTVAELAKSLGVRPGELYDQVKVEVEVIGADGEKTRAPVSLGELRRGYVDAKRLERDREAFETDSDKRSLAFMQTRAELEALGGLIAPHAPREVVDRMQAMIGERDAREKVLMLEAVPEWKDSGRFVADRSMMIEFLKPWGFKAADVLAIADHRIARFVRDMARQARRSAEAERKARERGSGAGANGEGKPRGQGAPDGRRSVAPLKARLANIVKAGRAATTQEGKTQAIGALLRATTPKR